MAEKELVTSVTFTISTKSNKYIRVNLTKDVKDVYNEIIKHQGKK